MVDNREPVAADAATIPLYTVTTTTRGPRDRLVNQTTTHPTLAGAVAAIDAAGFGTLNRVDGAPTNPEKRAIAEDQIGAWDRLAAFAFALACCERAEITPSSARRMRAALESLNRQGFPRDHYLDAAVKRGRLAAYRWPDDGRAVFGDPDTRGEW